MRGTRASGSVGFMRSLNTSCMLSFTSPRMKRWLDDRGICRGNKTSATRPEDIKLLL